MTDHYEVRKGIPFPKGTKLHKRIAFPFEDMDVGDYFTFPDEDRNRVSLAVYRINLEHPTTTYRVRGLGVWRTK